jgi:hypothetical protein
MALSFIFVSLLSWRSAISFVLPRRNCNYIDKHHILQLVESSFEQHRQQQMEGFYRPRRYPLYAKKPLKNTKPKSVSTESRNSGGGGGGGGFGTKRVSLDYQVRSVSGHRGTSIITDVLCDAMLDALLSRCWKLHSLIPCKYNFCIYRQW